MLDYNYIKNHYELIAVDLSRQKELDGDPKAIQKVEYVGQLKNVDGITTDGIQSMFILTIFEKIKEKRLKFSQGSVTVLQIMENYQEAIVTLTNTQLSKLKFAAKNKTDVILRINKENSRGRISTWIISNNKRNNLKFSKSQISIIIQSGGSSGSWLGNLGKEALANVAIFLVRDYLPG